jgi:hypothetical protein
MESSEDKGERMPEEGEVSFPGKKGGKEAVPGFGILLKEQCPHYSAS